MTATSLDMVTGGTVPAVRLEPGDTIRIRHHHAGEGPCRIGSAPLDVEVSAVDREASEQLIIVCWHGCRRLLGACPTVCGVSVFQRCERVLRIGSAARPQSYAEGHRAWQATWDAFVASGTGMGGAA